MTGSSYQYIGQYGSSQACLNAIRVILTGGYLASWGVEWAPTAATLVTRTGFSVKGHGEHSFVFWDWVLPLTIVPSGFTSGYAGEGPKALALALLMIRAKDIPIYEVGVDGSVFNRLNRNRLTDRDISCLERTGKRHELSAVGRYLDIVELPNRSDKYIPFRYACDRRIAWEWLDPELAGSCQELAEYDVRSALLKAFLVLKSRLVATFGVSESLDGEKLVNRVFGGNGILHAAAQHEEERNKVLAMRDLLSSLYRLFRNQYAHTQIEVPVLEAEAVLTMIDFVLKQLDGCQVGSNKPSPQV